jgi:hypothetical protein
MAVTNTNSDLMQNVDAQPPKMNGNNRSGAQLLFEEFDAVQGVAAGDALSRLRICQLPARARYQAMWTRFMWSAFGTGRLLSLGWERYRRADGVWVAEDADGLGAGLDVALAGSGYASAFPTGMITSMEFPAPVRLILVCTGGTIPAGARVQGIVAYGRG